MIYDESTDQSIKLEIFSKKNYTYGQEVEKADVIENLFYIVDDQEAGWCILVVPGPDPDSLTDSH